MSDSDKPQARETSQESSSSSSALQTPHTLRLLKLIQQGTLEHAQQATHILVQQVAPSLSLAQLWDLIGRLAECCLFHVDWKSRVNASVGIQGIMMLAAAALNNSGSDENDENETDTDTDPLQVFTQQTNGLTVETVSECLDQILAQGRPLYARSEDDVSGSDETDLLALDDQRTNQDPSVEQQDGEESFLQQRIRIQQEILQQRLGLAGIASAANDSVSEFLADAVTSQDLLSSDMVREPVRKRQRTIKRDNDTTAFDPKLRVLLVLEMEDQMRANNMSGEPNANTAMDGRGSSNPQTLLASEVIYRMLDPRWEIRHGATLACLGLVRAWYCQALRANDDDDDDDAAVSRGTTSLSFGAWPEHVMARCLCVLALDRFGDFGSGGGVVAPVQESAGQLLSVLVTMASRNVQDLTLQILYQLAKYEGDWEVRYGALVALKYLSVLLMKQSTVGSIVDTGTTASSDATWSLKHVERVVCIAVQALGDKGDDVKSIAAKILAEYIQHATTIPDTAYDCAVPLWLALQASSLVSACVPDLVLLLSLLIEHDCEKTLSRISDSGCRSNASVLEEVSGFLIRFLDSADATVRLSGMRCICSLAKALVEGLHRKLDASTEQLRVPVDNVIIPMLNRVFESYFEPDRDCAPDIVSGRRMFDILRDDAWNGLSRSCAALRSDLGTLQSADTGLIVRYFGLRSSRNRVRDMFEESTGAADALGTFLHVTQNGNSSGLRPLIELSISVFLRSPWPTQCEAACLLIISNARRSSPGVIPDSLSADLNDCLGLRRPDCLRYFSAHGKVYLDFLNDPTFSEVCDETFTQGSKLLMKNVMTLNGVCQSIVEAWYKIIRRRFPSHETALIAPSMLSMRLDATLAGAIIATKPPAKLTPVVRALVTSMKNEVRSGNEDSCVHANLLSPNLPSRLEYTSSHFQALVRGIDNKPEFAATERKLLQTLSDLVSDGNQVASRTMAELASVWTSKKPISEVPVVWDRLQKCDEGTASSIRLLGVVSSGFSDDSTKNNKSAIRRFIPTLVRHGCTSSHLLPSCLATLVAINKTDGIRSMQEALASLLPFLRNETDETERRAACELLDRLVSLAGVEICPFVRSLLPVVLSLLTDPVKECAGVSSKVFASLVRAAPLVQQIQSVNIEAVPTNAFSDEVIDHLILGKAMPSFPFPSLIAKSLAAGHTVLREYQKEGITWLRFLQSVNLNGALCDAMGLGKSLQALVAVALSHFSSGGKLEPGAISLIVCPASVVGHFAQEIDKFFPDQQVFQSLCLMGSTSVRGKLWNTLAPAINLVVTSYSVLRSDIEMLASKDWRYCVLDEGHLLCNPKTATAKASRRIRARHRLITSGTIIQNSVHELWAAFDFLMPNFLGDHAAFSTEFARPVMRGQVPGASVSAISESIEKLKVLHQQCLPFILRREKSKVLRELPPKVVSVVPVRMSALQEKIYSKFLEQPSAKAVSEKLRQIADGDNESAVAQSSSGDVLRSLLLLRLVCTHPALVHRTGDDRSVDDSQQGPAFGLEASGKLLALVELLRESGIYEDNTSGADNDRSLLFCGEDETTDFDSLVESTAGGRLDLGKDACATGESKCIIFAQFSKSLDIVERLVLDRLMPSVKYVRLDGRVPANTRAAIASSFNSNASIKVILATTRVGGLGLNLTGADMVIFLENDLNPFADLQASDRAHRIGQEKVLNVYSLVTCGSIEEKIMSLQQKKIAVAKAIVNTDNSTMYSMGTDRLLDIFTARTATSEDESEAPDLDALAAQICDEYEGLSMTTFLDSLRGGEAGQR